MLDHLLYAKKFISILSFYPHLSSLIWEISPHMKKPEVFGYVTLHGPSWVMRVVSARVRILTYVFGSLQRLVSLTTMGTTPPPHTSFMLHCCKFSWESESRAGLSSYCLNFFWISFCWLKGKNWVCEGEGKLVNRQVFFFFFPFSILRCKEPSDI